MRSRSWPAPFVVTEVEQRKAHTKSSSPWLSRPRLIGEPDRWRDQVVPLRRLPSSHSGIRLRAARQVRSASHAAGRAPRLAAGPATPFGTQPSTARVSRRTRTASSAARPVRRSMYAARPARGPLRRVALPHRPARSRTAGTAAHQARPVPEQPSCSRPAPRRRRAHRHRQGQPQPPRRRASRSHNTESRPTAHSARRQQVQAPGQSVAQGPLPAWQVGRSRTQVERGADPVEQGTWVRAGRCEPQPAPGPAEYHPAAGIAPRPPPHLLGPPGRRPVARLGAIDEELDRRRLLHGGSVMARGQLERTQRTSCSPLTFNGARLVASTDTCGQRASNSAISGAAARTCSKLSMTSRNGRSAKAAVNASSADSPLSSPSPMLAAISGSTAACSLTSSRGTNETGDEPSSQPARRLQGDSGFADPARTHHRDEAGARGKQILHCGDLPVPTEKTAQGRWHRRGPGRRRWLRLADGFLGRGGVGSAPPTARRDPPAAAAGVIPLPKALYATVSSSRIRDSRSFRRDSRFGAGALTYTRRGSPLESRYSSSRPETSSPGATQPYLAK